MVIKDPQEFAGSLTARRIDGLINHPALYEAAGSPIIEMVSAGSVDKSGWTARHADAMKREFLTRLGGGEAISAGVADERYVDVLVRSRPSEGATATETYAVPLSACLSAPGRRLVLLGGGGTGKTTLLLRTVIGLCESVHATPNAPTAIYARLNFFDARANAFDELMNIIARSAQLERAEAEALWAQRRRPCVFLLDGFNEVNPMAREACALALSELLQHSWHSYVITARPGDDIDKLALGLDAELLEMVSLDANQAQQFLNSYGLPTLLERIGPDLRELLVTPFLLWALAQIQAGLPGGKLPSSTGRLFEQLIDHYIFGAREQSKTGDARPTRYQYERVKKPVLGEIATQMCMVGVTRRREDRDLLATVRDRLREIRNEYEGIYPIVPHELMPDPPAAIELLEEIARNGVIRRAESTVEFAHESFRDYFAAANMVDWPLADIARSAPRLVWRQITPDFYDYRLDSSMAWTLTMIAGLRGDPATLVRALAESNPIIAAQCHADAPTPAGADLLAGVFQRMLQHQQPARRWIGCQCIGQARLRQQDLLGSLLDRIDSDREIFVRDAAARALGRIDDEQTIKKLVVGALVDTTPSDGYSQRKTTRVLWRARSERAVLEVFEAWRYEPGDTKRKTRAQELLVAMDRELVRKTLRAIAIGAQTGSDVAAAHDASEALSQLNVWKGQGLLSADHARYISNEASERFSRKFHKKVAELSACSSAEILSHVQDADASVRKAAVEILRQRREPTALDPFMEALVRRRTSR